MMAGHFTRRSNSRVLELGDTFFRDRSNHALSVFVGAVVVEGCEDILYVLVHTLVTKAYVMKRAHASS